MNSEHRIDRTALEKLKCGLGLIREAIKEDESLAALELGPMLRSIDYGLKVLASPDSDLSPADLALKYQWYVGKRFYVHATVTDASHGMFVVSSGQDIPEGVVISRGKSMPFLAEGEVVGVSVELKRKSSKIAWHIRAVDARP